jgi:hypothetical protein
MHDDLGRTHVGAGIHISFISYHRYYSMIGPALVVLMDIFSMFEVWHCLQDICAFHKCIYSTSATQCHCHLCNQKMTLRGTVTPKMSDVVGSQWRHKRRSRAAENRLAMSGKQCTRVRLESCLKTENFFDGWRSRQFSAQN